MYVPPFSGAVLHCHLQRAVLHAHKINVRIEGKKVYLSGSVSSWFEYNEATRAAFSVPGVQEIQNDLEIE